MSDNLRRYRAIHQALKQCYPGEFSGQMSRHLNTFFLFTGLALDRTDDEHAKSNECRDSENL